MYYLWTLFSESFLDDPDGTFLYYTKLTITWEVCWSLCCLWIQWILPWWSWRHILLLRHSRLAAHSTKILQRTHEGHQLDVHRNSCHTKIMTFMVHMKQLNLWLNSNQNSTLKNIFLYCQHKNKAQKLTSGIKFSLAPRHFHTPLGWMKTEFWF